MTIDNREMNRRLIRLSESSTSRFWRLDYKDLSPPERVFLVIWELESEVNNGGFHQYFYNSSGALAPRVVGALKTIGAQATADIVQRALDAVVNTITSWSDDANRQARVNQLSSETWQILEEIRNILHALKTSHRYSTNMLRIIELRFTRRRTFESVTPGFKATVESQLSPKRKTAFSEKLSCKFWQINFHLGKDWPYAQHRRDPWVNECRRDRNRRWIDVREVRCGRATEVSRLRLSQTENDSGLRPPRFFRTSARCRPDLFSY